MMRFIKMKIEAFGDINCNENLGGLFWFILCLEHDSYLCLWLNFLFKNFVWPYPYP